MREFFQDVAHHFIPFRGPQILLHAPKRNTDDIAMMDFGASILVADLQPHFVHDIDIFRPKARRVRSKIHKRRRPAGREDFQ